MELSEIFKDHLARPRNAGELPDATSVAEATNPICGDRLRLSLRVVGERIEATGFLAYGCPPTIVCGSALAEMLDGMTIEAANGLTRDIERYLTDEPVEAYPPSAVYRFRKLARKYRAGLLSATPRDPCRS